MKDCYPCYHQKNSNYYLLSNFYKEFTDFDLTQKDFVNFHGFENDEINTTMLELTIYFFLHVLQSNKGKTDYNFDFLLVFKHAKEQGIGQSFEDTFYTYLEENDTHVFTMEKKIFKL